MANWERRTARQLNTPIESSYTKAFASLELVISMTPVLPGKSVHCLSVHTQSTAPSPKHRASVFFFGNQSTKVQIKVEEHWSLYALLCSKFKNLSLLRNTMGSKGSEVNCMSSWLISRHVRLWDTWQCIVGQKWWKSQVSLAKRTLYTTSKRTFQRVPAVLSPALIMCSAWSDGTGHLAEYLCHLWFREESSVLFNISTV